jgi:AcrR family transcriptional regulator
MPDSPPTSIDAPGPPGPPGPPGSRRGRPRSDRVHRAILDAAQALLVEEGFSGLRLEHVAARAGVGKATIYRRWGSRQELALELLIELAGPHIPVTETGDTREELLATVMNPLRAVTETSFGPVIRALLSEIAVDARIGDRFREVVVQARRLEVARVVARGIERGDLRPDADVGIATELLAGPVYYRLVFGGDLDHRFAEQVVTAFLSGFGTPVTDADWF